MPKSQLPVEVAQRFGRLNPAVMATIHPDGFSVTVATWYLLEPDGRALVNFDAARSRLAHIHANPQISLTALDADSWYTHISVQGPVAQLADDVNLVDIDRLSMSYTGKPYSNRERPRISAWMTIERWHGWGAAKQPAQR